MRAILLVVPVVFVIAACSSKVITAGGPSGSADGGVDSGSGGPVDHRASGVTCAPTPVGSEPVIFDAGLPSGTRFDCHTNEDCTAHPNGRCAYVYQQQVDGPPANNLGTRCLYDECATDTDCPANSVCQCGSGGSVPNTCSVPGNCRVDADCPNGNLCSPSEDGCATFNGYYCHTASDTCKNDIDCQDQGGLSAKCIVDLGSSTWKCQEVGCAAAGGG